MRCFASCLPLLLASLYCPPATAETDAPAQSYGEASTGLGYPDMESGRTEIEMVDVDGDGNIDLAMVGDHGSPGVNTDQHGVTVWFGDGSGVWTPVQFGDFGYGGIALGDVDGDGLIDVGYGVHHNWASSDLGDQILEVALGNGTGAFWTAWDDGLAGNGETWGMMGSDFADVDGDGDLDLGSVSFGCCNGVHVYLNRGDGSWIQSYENSGRNSHQEFVFGEIDGDGWPDFAASHSLGTVYLNDGAGGFVVSDQGLPPTDEFEFLEGVSLGDANGDGRDDLAWINAGGGVEVWTRSVAGAWTDISGALPDTGGWSATQLWDLDGDGITDVAAFGGGQATTWKGDGTGGWTPLGSFMTQNPGTYTAFRVGGDIDHNGYPDFAVISKKQVSLFDDRNVPQCFRELTPPSTLRARIEKPVPGATLRSGSAGFVHWAAEIPGADPATVDLEYSVNGAAGPWHEVGTGLPDNGRHQWVVPDAAGAADFRLRVTVHTPGAGSSSAVGAGPMGVEFGSGTVELRFDDVDTLSWTDRTTGRSVYNLYRGDWDVLLSGGDYTQPPGGGADRWCSVTAGSQDDPYLPAAGEMVYYLASGVVDGLEGSLDPSSAGLERPNANPCE